MEVYFERFGDLNFLGILVSAVACFALGALWFSPAAFGKKWMEITGIKMEEKPDNMAQIFGFTFLCHVILAVAINYIGSGYDFKSGLVLGIMFSLIMLSMFAMNVLYENRPKEILWVSGGYYAVCIIITSVILAIW